MSGKIGKHDVEHTVTDEDGNPTNMTGRVNFGDTPEGIAKGVNAVRDNNFRVDRVDSDS
jgi:hypothetical protein